MHPKEQGVLMWQTEFELQFLLPRKPGIYQPDLGQIAFANITLHCLVLASFSARWVEFAAIGNWNHSRQFRQLIKVSKLNLVYVKLILCCLNKPKHLRANTKQYLEYLLIRVQDLHRVTSVHAEVQTLSHTVNTQARITYSHTYGQFRLCT